MTDRWNSSSPAAQSELSDRTGLIGRLRGDILFVVSAIGTALTVISALQSTLTVASWARALVDSFQAAAMSFWALALPWLTVAPRPLDVVFLNMSAFFALVTIGSLSPRAAVPGSWRKIHWGRELLAGVGTSIAVVVFIWAGFSSVQQHLAGQAFTQFMAAADAARTVEESDLAALTYMTEISAFVPAVDWFGQIIGMTSGPLVERLDRDVFMLMALHIAIILMPCFAVLGVGAACGFRMDSRKTSRWAWLFLALVAGVLSLGWVDATWVAICAELGAAGLDHLCRLVE